MTRDDDIPGIFEARLKFYEAGLDLYNRISNASPILEERVDATEEARMYQMQGLALLMSEPELEAHGKNAKGVLAAAISDEVRRRSELTRHQAAQEAGPRTKGLQDRQLRISAVRGVRREGVER